MQQEDVSAKVFLADDSALIRGCVARLLSERAITVVGEADTPEASIKGILASRPDVVVLDVKLAGGSGLEVLRSIRLSAPQIAFVVFSNHSGEAYRRRYLREGAEHFLDKCAEFDQLADVIAQMFADRGHLPEATLPSLH